VAAEAADRRIYEFSCPKAFPITPTFKWPVATIFWASIWQCRM